MEDFLHAYKKRQTSANFTLSAIHNFKYRDKNLVTSEISHGTKKFICNEFRGTVKLSYNKQLGTGKIHFLKLGIS
jgi:hypothetical protein